MFGFLGETFNRLEDVNAILSQCTDFSPPGRYPKWRRISGNLWSVDFKQ